MRFTLIATLTCVLLILNISQMKLYEIICAHVVSLILFKKRLICIVSYFFMTFLSKSFFLTFFMFS